jgi:hypothetical protein
MSDQRAEADRELEGPPRIRNFMMNFGPHHSVSRRVLRPEIHHKIPDARRPFELPVSLCALIAHGRSFAAASPSADVAFSSPGRI